MRPPGEMPQRQPRPKKRRRRRAWLIVIALALLVLLVSARGVALFWTDYLWFESVGYESVFRRRLAVRTGLALVFSALFFVLLYSNLLLADRLAPRHREPGPEEDFLVRYRHFIGHREGAVRVGVAVFLALVIGVGMNGQWQNWLMFTNSESFGVTDPQFGRDVGFYIFRLPFLASLVAWFISALIVVFVVTAVAHYLNGGIRLQGRGERATPQVKAHLSLLLGAIALVKAFGYYLDQFELTWSTRGFVTGATATDVNAQLPAIRLLIAISIFSFALLVFNLWRRGFTYPLIAVGLWAFVAVLAGSIFPAAYQRFIVQPAESTKERPYIERNIDATQFALGLDKVKINPYPFDPDLSVEQIETDLDIVENVRLIDPGIVADTVQQLQSLRSFYRFTDVDVDRYEIDGATTQVVVSARELNTASIPNPSWEASHVAFTHGHGLALAPSNAIDSNGRPRFVVRDVPLEVTADAPSLRVDQPDLYFGEQLDGYAIVDARRDEVDYETNSGQILGRYSGVDGVDSGSLLRRMAFFLRFDLQTNLLFSSQVKSDSRLVFRRDIRERVEALAPFLAYDADPYPVILDGRVIWVMDAYTHSTRFPYGEVADVREVDSSSGLSTRLNYVRNSVKVTVDAYDGTVQFYVIDPDDPMVRGLPADVPRPVHRRGAARGAEGALALSGGPVPGPDQHVGPLPARARPVLRPLGGVGGGPGPGRRGGPDPRGAAHRGRAGQRDQRLGAAHRPAVPAAPPPRRHRGVVRHVPPVRAVHPGAARPDGRTQGPRVVHGGAVGWRPVRGDRGVRARR